MQLRAVLLCSPTDKKKYRLRHNKTVALPANQNTRVKSEPNHLGHPNKITRPTKPVAPTLIKPLRPIPAKKKRVKPNQATKEIASKLRRPILSKQSEQSNQTTQTKSECTNRDECQSNHSAQPSPRKLGLKSGIWAAFFPTANIFSWVGIDFT